MLIWSKASCAFYKPPVELSLEAAHQPLGQAYEYTSVSGNCLEIGWKESVIFFVHHFSSPQAFPGNLGTVQNVVGQLTLFFKKYLQGDEFS